MRFVMLFMITCLFGINVYAKNCGLGVTCSCTSFVLSDGNVRHFRTSFTATEIMYFH